MRNLIPYVYSKDKVGMLHFLRFYGVNGSSIGGIDRVAYECNRSYHHNGLSKYLLDYIINDGVVVATIAHNSSINVVNEAVHQLISHVECKLGQTIDKRLVVSKNIQDRYDLSFLNVNVIVDNTLTDVIIVGHKGFHNLHIDSGYQVAINVDDDMMLDTDNFVYKPNLNIKFDIIGTKNSADFYGVIKFT